MSVQKVLSVLCILLLVGCASQQDISEKGKLAQFASSKSAAELGICINKNTDRAIAGSLVTSMNPLEPLRIVVWNGSTVYAVIQIKETISGSVADYRLGLLAAMAPEAEVERMARGCA